MSINVTGVWVHWDDLNHVSSWNGIELVRDEWTNDDVMARWNADSFVYLHGGNDIGRGRDGDDTFYDNAALNGRPVTINGVTYYPPGSGSSGNDTIYGGNGNDTIYGGDGINVYDGQSGTDTVDYANATQAISVTGTGTGQAQVLGFGSSTLNSIEWINGSSFADTFQGSDAVDRFRGGEGNDTLRGGGGSDELVGGAGDDLIVGGAGADSIVGEAGIDTASYLMSSAGIKINLFAGTADGGDAKGDKLSGIENIQGSHYDDIIIGDNEDNVLSGYAGNDVIDGGLGNDTIFGSDGNDTMSGGKGSDVFLFAAEVGFEAHGPDHDVIKDFDANAIGGQDLIDLSALGITSSNFAQMVKITDLGADTLVTIGEMQDILLVGVSGIGENQITQADFILA
ncbi:MAG: calcium-binding protein [Hyphomicrobiaceae bacterium]